MNPGAKKFQLRPFDGDVMRKELEKLLRTCSENEREERWKDLEGFLNMYEKYLIKEDKSLLWNDVDFLTEKSFADYGGLEDPCEGSIQELLNKIVVVKLNGGLGTSMKCNGPKSLLPVRNGLTFLDLVVHQIKKLNERYQVKIPLVLMNSFSTCEQTENELKKFKRENVDIYNFMQSKYPRLNAETMKPLPKSYDDPNLEAWYPPGHGDFYQSFYKSNLLKKFKEEGREVCFLSNIDNVKATVDLKILNFILKSDHKPDFIMEVTKKLKIDVKGGVLYRNNSRTNLIEIAQFPEDSIEQIKDSEKLYFNTNNLWMKLEAISKLVEEQKLPLGVIENRKKICHGAMPVEVIQLETASGAAISEFPNAVGMMVPRTRFLAVKHTSDLFLIRSNVFQYENGAIDMNSNRIFNFPPMVNFSEEFSYYGDLERNFETIPDCLYLTELTVSGRVTFGKHVVLRGRVSIIADKGKEINIPSGSVIQNKIITGSLRIIDH